MSTDGNQPLNRECLDGALDRFQTRLERRIRGLIVWWLTALLMQAGSVLAEVHFLLTQQKL